MKNDLLYQMALSRIPGIGPVFSKRILEHFGDAHSAFHAGPDSLKMIQGIGDSKANAISTFTGFEKLEKELAFLEKYGMRPLFYTDKDYPQRLLTIDESPILLFYKGTADLNAGKIISVIGTRNSTDYGRQVTERLIRELTIPGVLIVSGLAYGIDTLAHKAALKNDLPTIGVLGHGLDMIYPPENTRLAKDMVKQGGLLTQFSIGTAADDHNFPVRNKIVAGICDALIVVESGPKGGSMITINDGINYHKRIFAIPGRITDDHSAGCNMLIQKGQAKILNTGKELLNEMNWLPPDRTLTASLNPEAPDYFKASRNPETRQVDLFSGHTKQSSILSAPSPLIAGKTIEHLPPDEKAVIGLLRNKGTLSADELSIAGGLRHNELAAILLNLEVSGFVTPLPGKRFRLSL
jgi:DNA processing protein